MVWQSLIPLAISGAASYFGSKGDSKESETGSVGTRTLMPEWQTRLGSDLSDWARKFLSAYRPGESYTGKLSAGISPMETQGLGQLQGLLNGPATGDLFSAARGQVLDTLSGKYADPSTSPFIQAYTKLAGQNLRDAITTARGQRGARGTYFTDAGIQEESRLSERTQNYLNALIGDFIQSERGRQVNAVGQARDLEEYGTDSVLKRVSASQSLGALPRLLEQADLERDYQAWLNQRSELSAVPGIAGNVFGTRVPTLTNLSQPQSPTSGSDIAPWITLAMQYLGKN